MGVYGSSASFGSGSEAAGAGRRPPSTSGATNPLNRRVRGPGEETSRAPVVGATLTGGEAAVC